MTSPYCRSAVFPCGMLAIFVGTLVGCNRPSPPQPEPCVGERVAVRVHNATAATVDVYFHVGQSRNASILGTVPPGAAELQLPPNDKTMSLSFESRRANGTTVAPTFGNREEYARITYELVCAN